MITIGIDKRTELRQLCLDDAGAIAGIVLENYDHLHEWLPWVNEDYSAEVTSAFVESAMKKFQEGESFHALVLDVGRIAGQIGFNAIDRADDWAEIGYWLASEFEGSGLMTRCCRALINYGFDEFALNRIVIRCATENTKSQAIPSRLGFTVEGVLREAEKLHGRYVDLKVFSLLKSEWEND